VDCDAALARVVDVQLEVLDPADGLEGICAFSYGLLSETALGTHDLP
jgi:hypothetical protein